MSDTECIEMLKELIDSQQADGYRVPMERALRVLKEQAGAQQRSNKCRSMPLRKLVGVYAFETCRINKEDKTITQNLVRSEIVSRVQDLFKALDESPELAPTVYKQFIEG